MRGIIILLILLVVLPATAIYIIHSMESVQAYTVAIPPSYKVTSSNAWRYRYSNSSTDIFLYGDFTYDENNSVWYTLFPSPSDWKYDRELLIALYYWDNLTKVGCGVIRIHYKIVFEKNVTDEIPITLYAVYDLWSWGYPLTEIGKIYVNNSDIVEGEITFKFDKIKLLQYEQKYRNVAQREPRIVGLRLVPNDQEQPVFKNAYWELHAIVEKPTNFDMLNAKLWFYSGLGILYFVAGLVATPFVNIINQRRFKRRKRRVTRRRRAMAKISGVGLGIVIGIALVLIVAILWSMKAVEIPITDLWGYTKQLNIESLLFPATYYGMKVPSLIGVALATITMCYMAIRRIHPIIALITSLTVYTIGCYFDTILSMTSDVITMLQSEQYTFAALVYIIGYTLLLTVALVNAITTKRRVIR